MCWHRRWTLMSCGCSVFRWTNGFIITTGNLTGSPLYSASKIHSNTHSKVSIQKFQFPPEAFQNVRLRCLVGDPEPEPDPCFNINLGYKAPGGKHSNKPSLSVYSPPKSYLALMVFNVFLGLRLLDRFDVLQSAINNLSFFLSVLEKFLKRSM